MSSALNSVPRRTKLTKVESNAFESLKNDGDITIVPAYKGNVTLTMSTNDYNDKIDERLCDTSTYELIIPNTTENSTYPSAALMRKLNLLLKDMKLKKLINEEQYKYMYVNSPTNPLFYFPIKIYKKGYLIRAIVAFNDSPTCHSSQCS